MLARIRRKVLAVVALAVAIYLFLLPALIAIHDLRDPALAKGEIPRAAWRLLHSLAPVYEQWARDRVASGRAGQLAIDDISGTEWPVFGSVFFLWAVESMQVSWEKHEAGPWAPPKASARGAVERAVSLVLDDHHASWVKRHWGPTYLEQDDLFYRALRLAAMAVHVRLYGQSSYFEQLRRESEALAAELDRSPFGLLEDYPGQCYPADVLVAWAILHRAAAVLGTDDSAYIARALRGFAGRHVDTHGLPPYACDIGTGLPVGSSRGCSNSYVLLVAAELWPEQAQDWYDRHTRFFWQWQHGVAGFREFPADTPEGNWYADVDSGPVIAGHGVAAPAFGLGAALVNGHPEHARPLLAELFAVSWPLPSGTLLLPRLLSNATDAPYLGEAAVLYVLTRQPVPGTPVATATERARPGLVYLALGGQLALGCILALPALRALCRRRRS
jgi:hypothetical protein